MADKVPQLFDSDSDMDPSQEVVEIDKGYAKRYNAFREKEDRQRLKDLQNNLKKAEAESSSSDEEDNPLSRLTLQQVHRIAECFEDSGVASSSGVPKTENEVTSAPKQKKKKAKKEKKEEYTIIDLYKELAERRERGETFEFPIDEAEPPPPKHIVPQDLFGSVVDLPDDIFKFVPEDNQNFEKEIKHKKSHQEKIEEAKERLRKALYKPNMTNEDKFLADYIIDNVDQAVDEEDDTPNDEDDRSFHYNNYESSDAMNGFIYPDEAEATRNTIAEAVAKVGSSATHIPTSYPRDLTGTVRIKDTRRKDARARKKLRKEEEKRRMREEIKELQAVKRKEIEQRLAMIKQASGQEQLAFEDEDLDENFDPEKHDAKMEAQFNNEYYDVDDKEKPTFEHDSEIDGDFDADLEDYDENTTFDNSQNNDEDGADDDAREIYGDVNDDNEETLYSRNNTNSKKRSRGSKSKFREALLRPKPKFDVIKHKDFDKYIDEYYGLDCEDVVGGIKCRFKYKEVEPNNFGLTTEEILMANDKELNRHFSLRRMLEYNRTKSKELAEKKIYSKHARDENRMQKIFPSLYVMPEEEAEEKDVVDEAEAQRLEEERKKKKNLKKKLRRERKAAEEAEAIQNPAPKEVTPDKANHVDNTAQDNTVQSYSGKRKRDAEDTNSKKKKKRKHETKKVSNEKNTQGDSGKNREDRKAVSANDPLSSIMVMSKDRLLAYGVPNPSKLKSKAKYYKRQEEKGLVKDANTAFKFSTSKKGKNKAKKKNKNKEKKTDTANSNNSTKS